MTKVTARPMPVAVCTLLETPRKGQQPRKREKMKLLQRMQLTMNRKKEPTSVILMTYSSFPALA